MIIRDDYIREMFGKLQLRKLKGHVRLELHNCRTGKTIVEEGENTVTYAVRDILANNVMSALNVGSLAPLWSNWYGGILCYKQAHPLVEGQLDPSDYFIRGNDIQELTAHAGNTAPSDYADDKKRGSPNTAQQVFTENSVKQGWEWGSTQGNGVIGALSLTHKDVGNAGTGAVSSAFASFEPFAPISEGLSNLSVSVNSANNIFAQYDESHGLWFHIGDASEFYSGHTNFATKKLTVIIRKLPYKKVGLYDTENADTTYQRSFVIDLTNNLYLQPAWYFDYDNKKLWIFNNVTSVMGGSESYSAADINYAIIDCENEELVSEGTVTSDTSNIAPLAMCHVPQAGWRDMYISGNILKIGNYFCFPTTSGVSWGNASDRDFGQNVNGIKQINFSDTSDQHTLASFNTSQKHFRCAMTGGGIIINGGRVINGGVGYNCANNYLLDFSNSTGYNTFAGTWAFSTPNRISSYVVPIGSGDHATPTSLSRYILANKLVNTTLYNLNTPQRKDATQSMTVTYTLTESADEEE